jgi:hypothetical protein
MFYEKIKEGRMEEVVFGFHYEGRAGVCPHIPEREPNTCPSNLGVKLPISHHIHTTNTPLAPAKNR